MKHTKWETIVLLAWFVVAALLGLLLVGVVEPLRLSLVGGGELSGWSLIAFVVGAILIGSIMWLLVLRVRPKNVPLLFAVGMGALYGSFIDMVVVLNVVERVVVWGVCVVGYYMLVKKIKSTRWGEVQKWVQVNNVVMVLGISFIAAQLAVSISVWVALVLFAVVAVYDWVAVWKIGSMQRMALGFIDVGVLPGIAVAKRRRGQFAILGGGDVFFLVVVAGVLMRYAVSLGVFVALGIISAIVLLFMYSEKERFYPALPFMFGGMVLGMVVWWVVVVLGMVVWWAVV